MTVPTPGDLQRPRSVPGGNATLDAISAAQRLKSNISQGLSQEDTSWCHILFRKSKDGELGLVLKMPLACAREQMQGVGEEATHSLGLHAFNRAPKTISTPLFITY